MGTMLLSTQLDFAAAPAEVSAMLTDAAFLERVCAESDALEHSVEVTGNLTRVSRTLAAPCLLYTSPSPRDGLLSRMPSSA